MRAQWLMAAGTAMLVSTACGVDEPRPSSLARTSGQTVSSGVTPARGMASPLRKERAYAAVAGNATVADSGTVDELDQSARLGQVRDTSVAPSMIIRTGQAMIEVDSLEVAIARVQQLAARLGGYVANTSIQAGRNQLRTATLDVKLPAPRWQEARTGLAPIGKVETITESTEDVGEEFVDVNARMANARRLEERLISLLATRTGKLQDVLAVERELARVREEIERFEGRSRFLRTRAAISTLTITVHETAPLIANQPGRSVIGEAFKDAWRNFVGFVAEFIRSLGVLLPLAVLAGVVVWIVRRRNLWPPRSSTPRQPPGPRDP